MMSEQSGVEQSRAERGNAVNNISISIKETK